MGNLEPGDIPKSRPRLACVRSAGRHAARQSTSRPFLWPSCGDPDLSRYGFISCSCGRFGVALAGPAQALDPGTARFVAARLEGLPSHLRAVSLDLYGPDWAPLTIEQLGDVLCNFADVFSKFKTDLVPAP